ASLEVPYFLAKLGQLEGCLQLQPTLVGNDLGLFVARRIGEFDGHKALAGGVFEVFEDTLVARIVRDCQEKVRVRLQDLPLLVDRQDAAVVSERVDEDDSILA